MKKKTIRRSENSNTTEEGEFMHEYFKCRTSVPRLRRPCDFEDVSFRLLKGEHIGLVGANGEGKSTFMNIITGKLMPDEGKVEWAKMSVSAIWTSIPFWKKV